MIACENEINRIGKTDEDFENVLIASQIVTTISREALNIATRGPIVRDANIVVD